MYINSRVLQIYMCRKQIIPDLTNLHHSPIILSEFHHYHIIITQSIYCRYHGVRIPRFSQRLLFGWQCSGSTLLPRKSHNILNFEAFFRGFELKSWSHFTLTVVSLRRKAYVTVSAPNLCSVVTVHLGTHTLLSKSQRAFQSMCAGQLEVFRASMANWIRLLQWCKPLQSRDL